jgi:hypothetical protein
MIIDRQNMFSNETAITTDAISNVIDLGPLGGSPDANTIRDIGAGKTLYLHILVTTTFDTAGEDGTLDVTLESDSAAALNVSATVHLTIPQVAEAALVAGYWIAKGLAIPAGAYERFLGLRYNVGSSAFTSGAVSAWLSENRYDDRTYETVYTSGVN